MTKLYTDEAVDFIKSEKEEPFFLYFSHHIPHTPIEPSAPFKGESGKRGGVYGDFVLELDHSVGRVLDAVDEAGIAENTLIVFLSDNGPARFGTAKPLSGGKYVTMEGGHRVPAVFAWPGRIPAGRVSDAMITSMDLLPLFCDVAGAELPADRTIDGKNIYSLLTGETERSPHDYFYYYNGLNLQAVRNERWKLHFPRTAADQPYWAKKSSGGNPKKIHTTLKEPLLFDLKEDVGEKRNVFADHPEIVGELMAEAERVRTAFKAVLFSAAVTLISCSDREGDREAGAEEVLSGYYVATDGDDRNLGTSLGQPLASIQAAVDKMKPGDTCYIRGGTYREEIDLKGKAGAPGQPITLTRYQNEEVTLDGTVKIDGTWTLDEGNVYKATLDRDITQLFVDGKLMTLARFPNALAFSEEVWDRTGARCQKTRSPGLDR